MAIRQFEFTVTDNGITPATEQKVSIQTEHAAAELCFTLQSDLFAKLNEENGTAVYRFDCYDGVGGNVKTESRELTENVVKLTVEESITRHGGKVTVYLVITVINSEGKTSLEFLSAPARLRIEQIPNAVSDNGESKESFSTLAEVTKKYASEAAEAKDETLAVKNELEKAISEKADSEEVASELEAIKTSLDGKAEQTDVEKLETNLINTDAHIDYVEEKTDDVISTVTSLSDAVSSKMDKFGSYYQYATSKGIRIEAPFYISESQGSAIGFQENRTIIYSHGGPLSLGTTNGHIVIDENQIDLVDSSTYPVLPIRLTGVKTPDSTNLNDAVNVEYINNTIGDINSVLSKLVNTEE